jgi:hypothetical protein
MLNHDTELNVIIPDNCNQEKIPVLWLLHGMHDNHSGWCRRTGIERYANAYKIAVVCPDGENSYYTNMVYGKRYFDFLTDELVAFVRKTFRLSDRREDNFICGLSMGGYGALHTALMRPDLYSAAASLSGVADIVSRLQVCAWTHEARMVWGDNFKENVKNCEADIMWLAENFPKDSEKPRIFSILARSHAGKRPAAADKVESSAIFFDLLTVKKVLEQVVCCLSCKCQIYKRYVYTLGIIIYVCVYIVRAYKHKASFGKTICYIVHHMGYCTLGNNKYFIIVMGVGYVYVFTSVYKACTASCCKINIFFYRILGYSFQKYHLKYHNISIIISHIW